MRSDPYQERARELARECGLDPDSRVGFGRGQPVWCTFRDAARAEHLARESEALAKENVSLRPQEAEYQNAPLVVYGDHEQSTLDQMRNCMSVGNVVKGVMCADGHLGYAQPVGGVIAYDGQISVSGVGFDIGCGNMAVRTDVRKADVNGSIDLLNRDISRHISFGVGRTNNEKVEHSLFDKKESWLACGMEDYRAKAQAQLGTVGSGNHYVDLMEDEDGYVWVGVHFGSRGLGHTIATRHIKLAGGRDGINVPPALVDSYSDLGLSYHAGMTLAGEYAYAGREWVVNRVVRILGGKVDFTVHNHHNFAWWEEHDGRMLWVVRKGATPAFPGQLGFIGGSMGDDAVIVEGVDSPKAKDSLYSTVHGAGRIFGRKEAKRRFSRAEMDRWLHDRGVHLLGADLDESPMAYRRLPDVLAHHDGTVKIRHTLRPFAVVMAGAGEIDPYKD